jgi:uncharacterized Fe-S cluster-containing radical SAM superfamily protein
MTDASIDTAKFSAELRTRGVRPDTRSVLVTRFAGSEQERDLTLPANCGGFGRVHHFRRDQGAGWPENPLPIEPACVALGLDVPSLMRAQVFQNAICSWRCWYCFVDFKLLSGDLRYAEFRTADELIDLFLAESDRPRIIDLSGGQPDLVPEWTIWFAEALERRGLTKDYYLWSDDNLSNDYLWRYATSDQIGKLARSATYGRVGCFKGWNETSFVFNTRAPSSEFRSQFDLMARLVRQGFDVYAYATLTGPSTEGLPSDMARFVDLLQEKVHPIFPLRLVPLRIHPFSPMRGRLRAEEQQRALAVQEEAVSAWSEELDRRFEASVRERSIVAQALH